MEDGIASGLKLHGRLAAIQDSLERLAQKGGKLCRPLKRLRGIRQRTLERTTRFWPDLEVAYD